MTTINGLQTVPLHPGMGIVLRRFLMDETEVALALASGELRGPQFVVNSWYFSLRITGTGTSFRSQLGEIVYRPEHVYLDDAFLARCNGLPVIIQHPGEDKQYLDSTEYAERNIGSIVLPFIGRDGVIDPSGDEVWGIARIIDIPAAEFMLANQLSTSPDVVFLDATRDNTKVQLDDKIHLLLEGKPGFIDHLAVCVAGVWDKGGPPMGVDLGINPDNPVFEDIQNLPEGQAAMDSVRIDALVDRLAVAELESIIKKLRGPSDGGKTK